MRYDLGYLGLEEKTLQLLKGLFGLSLHMGNLVRALIVCTALIIACSLVDAKAANGQIKKLLKDDTYTVTLGAATNYPEGAELEIGDGYGHAGMLNWMWFRPRTDVVDVLSLQIQEEMKPYSSKWPPDTAQVVVKHAEMGADAYSALLRDLAIVETARLKPVERKGPISIRFSSNDFWVQAYLTKNKKTLIDLDWAGYENSGNEVDYAKPRAAVRLAQGAVRRLNFKEHLLTPEERTWASAKFVRDWSKFKDREFYWWVREEYISMIGIIGDATALPTLQHILGGNPKDIVCDYAGFRTKDRCVYLAINAITRLVKKDVRDMPVEEMDIEKVRQRVFDLLMQKHLETNN